VCVCLYGGEAWGEGGVGGVEGDLEVVLEEGEGPEVFFVGVYLGVRVWVGG
jgi:hypothetical protein